MVFAGLLALEHFIVVSNSGFDKLNSIRELTMIAQSGRTSAIDINSGWIVVIDG